ncbi:MAG: hypothetical protein IJ722_01655 [Alloprevotella sp.]|nr:hypothetical protein [Alloprevotella sp.]
MNNEKTLDGALCADVGTADAEGAVPAAGRKKYVPPTMQVIPLGPQRMLATSGGLPQNEGCYYYEWDGGTVPKDVADAVIAALDPATLQSNPRLLVSALEQAGFSYALNQYVYDAGWGIMTTLRNLLNSAVITSASTDIAHDGYVYSNGTVSHVQFSFDICGYVPDEYEFCVGALFYDAGGNHPPYRFPRCADVWESWS